MERHIETFSLSRFVNFHGSYSIDEPKHAVGKDERPRRGVGDRAELDQEEVRVAPEQAIHAGWIE